MNSCKKFRFTLNALTLFYFTTQLFDFICGFPSAIEFQIANILKLANEL